MTTYTWEHQLVGKAEEAWRSPFPSLPLTADDHALADAYAYCARVTKQHSRTFYMASGLMPAEQRLAARALYAFCRVTDDIVDNAEHDVRKQLDSWQQRSLHMSPTPHDPVTLAWADARSRFAIPKRYAEQLIEGVATDLAQNRYQTFETLAPYCYGVASTVGLMTMYITGFENENAIRFAIKLGVALQLTNILRDVAEDWRIGRLYLPLNELAAYGLSEDDIAAGVVDDRWRNFMRFQIERARDLYAEALPGVAMLGTSGRFAIAAAAELYRGILDDIEAHDYDVFSRRAYIGTAAKLGRLPGIYYRARTNQYEKMIAPPAPKQVLVATVCADPHPADA